MDYSILQVLFGSLNILGIGRGMGLGGVGTKGFGPGLANRVILFSVFQSALACLNNVGCKSYYKLQWFFVDLYIRCATALIPLL